MYILTSNNLEDDIKAIFLDTFPNMKENEFDLDKKQEEYEKLGFFCTFEFNHNG